VGSNAGWRCATKSVLAHRSAGEVPAKPPPPPNARSCRASSTAKAAISTIALRCRIAQPSAPQFSSSQAVIRACCRPRPSGGTAMRMRTGKRGSAPVISSRGLPAFCSTFVLYQDYMRASPCPAAWASAPAPLCSRYVWPRPSLVQCQRDQARLPSASTDPEYRAQLKRGANRSPPATIIKC
jgi:hypothetical protein